jgi:hypothetical protein
VTDRIGERRFEHERRRVGVRVVRARALDADDLVLVVGPLVRGGRPIGHQAQDHHHEADRNEDVSNLPLAHAGPLHVFENVESCWKGGNARSTCLATEPRPGRVYRTSQKAQTTLSRSVNTSRRVRRP